MLAYLAMFKIDRPRDRHDYENLYGVAMKVVALTAVLAKTYDFSMIWQHRAFGFSVLTAPEEFATALPL